MHILAVIAGFALIIIAVVDAFRTMVLPRRVAGRFRLTRLFFLLTWKPWEWLASRSKSRRGRETLLSVYGPASLFALLTLWAAVLILGFATVFWGCRSPYEDKTGRRSWPQDIYVSGTTLFTLGLGDVVPDTRAARILVIVESGMGFGLLAVVLGYLPVLYGAFSRREAEISLLDARAGSPPSAVEMIRRHAYPGGEEDLAELLEHWERWCAEILESHISYPVLCFFRSQHDNQSWLAAITAILDTCSLVLTGLEGHCARQAELTYAMARHTLVDIAQTFSQQPACELATNRMAPGTYPVLAKMFCSQGIQLDTSSEAEQRLTDFRSLYEGYTMALSKFLRMPIEGWIVENQHKDNWRTVARIAGRSRASLEANPFLRLGNDQDEH